MKQCKIIAITGRSGSGKSVVSAYYRKQGYPVIDADKVARDITQSGSPCLASLAQAFGTDILAKDGSLLRHELANRAFATPEGTKKLTDITHPAIVQELLSQVSTAQKQGASCVFVDGAVIVGAPFEPYCDAILVVTAPEHLAIERIVARDSITAVEAKCRLDAQMSQEMLCAASQWHIANDCDLEVLLQRAQTALQSMI